MMYNDKVIYSVKTQHILVIITINLATCFGFTEPSSGQFLKHCAQSLNVLCFRNWPEDGSVNRKKSPVYSDDY